MDETQVTAFFDLLDEAVLDPERWRPALQRLSDLVDGDTWALMSHANNISIWRHDDDLKQAAFHSRYLSNPIQLATERHMKTLGPLPRVAPDYELLPRDEFVATPYFKEFLRPNGVEWIVLMSLTGSESHAAFNVTRSAGKGPLTDDQLACLNRFQPSLQRSFWLGLKLAERERVNRGLADFFDQSPNAVILAGGDGRVLRANPAATAMLRAADGLIAVHGHLRASSPELTARLLGSIANAASGAARGAITMRIPTPGRRLPLSVEISPVRADRFADLWGGRSAIVCVTDPEARVTPPARALRELFGLTEAEARVALALLNGSRPREVAETLGLSFQTVRAYLRGIFQKTDTHRQADLMRLMMRTMGARRDGGGPAEH